MKYAILSALILIHPNAAALEPQPSDPDNSARQTVPNARPYHQECVVRVRTTSQSQLDAVLNLASDVWSERIGVGVLEVQIAQAKLPQLSLLHVPHDMLIPDLQAHAEQRHRQMNDVRARQSLQQPDGFERGGTVHDESWFETYRTLAEIEAYTENIATLRPDLASVSVIGQSWEGRDMHAITISAPDTPENPRAERAAVFVFSTVHAREWIAPMTTCYIASKLVEQYDLDAGTRDLLEHTRAIIVPIGNPDGYAYTWSNERYWRNTRRDNGDGTFGVNINRNWGYEWGNQGSSGDTSNTNYRGTHPFSEPETSALRDLALSLGDHLVAHIDYHSYSQLIMWPFGYRDNVDVPAPYGGMLREAAEGMAASILATDGGEVYDPIQSIDLYAAAGDSPDWFFGELERMSYTIELRPAHADFSPPDSEIIPCAIENYAAFKTLIQHSVFTDRFVHTPVDVVDEGDGSTLRLHRFTGAGPSGGLDQPVLHTRVSGQVEFNDTPMTPARNRSYVADLPESPCGDTVEYYFSADDMNGQPVLFPPGGASEPFITRVMDRSFTLIDELESDEGWFVGSSIDSATAGIWEHGIPEGTTAQPEGDHTPDGTSCWVTGAAAGDNADANDVDGGYTSLTSPRFSAFHESVISFWFWQSVEIQPADQPLVQFSNDDGQHWVGGGFLPNADGNDWHRYAFRLSDYLEPTHDMRVRFVARDQREDSTVECAVDDVRVGVPGCPLNAADLYPDGRLDFLDVSRFIELYIASSSAADFEPDGTLNYFDVAAYLKQFLSQ